MTATQIATGIPSTGAKPTSTAIRGTAAAVITRVQQRVACPHATRALAAIRRARREPATAMETPRMDAKRTQRIPCRIVAPATMSARSFMLLPPAAPAHAQLPPAIRDMAIATGTRRTAVKRPWRTRCSIVAPVPTPALRRRTRPPRAMAVPADSCARLDSQTATGILATDARRISGRIREAVGAAATCAAWSMPLRGAVRAAA